MTQKPTVNLSQLRPYLESGELTSQEAVANFNVIDDEAQQETAAPSPQPQQEEPGFFQQLGQRLINEGPIGAHVGALKGVANTTRNIANMVQDGSSMLFPSLVPPSGSQGDQMYAEMIQPEGTAQEAGYAAEQLAEYIIPGSAAQRAVRGVQMANPAARMALSAATEGGVAGSVAAAQTGGDPQAMAQAATIGAAAVPLSAGFSALATRWGSNLMRRARAQYERAVGIPAAVTRAERGRNERLIPEMMRRNMTPDQLKFEALEDAKDMIGAALGAARQDPLIADTGVTAGAIVRQLDDLKSRFVDPSGAVHPGQHRYARLVDQWKESITRNAGESGEIAFGRVQNLISALDSEISAVRNGYARPGVSASDSLRLATMREVRGIFDDALSGRFASVDDLEREYAFLASAAGVMEKAIKKNTELTSQVLTGGGATAGALTGFASGEDLGDRLKRAATGAALGAIGGRLLAAARSPRWQATSATLKSRVLDFLQDGRYQEAGLILSRFIAADQARDTAEQSHYAGRNRLRIPE